MLKKNNVIWGFIKEKQDLGSCKNHTDSEE